MSSSSPKALIGDQIIDCAGNPSESYTFPFLPLVHPFQHRNTALEKLESTPLTIISVEDTNFEKPSKLIACSQEQIQHALRCADVVSDANSPWSSLTLTTRHEILKEAAAEIDKEQKLYAKIDVMETGIPLSVQYEIVGGLAPVALMSMEKAIKDVLDCKQKVPSRFGGNIIGKRRPITPSLICAPSNVPCGTIIPKLFVALLCGCKVIVKPSEHAPTSITKMCETIHKIIFGKYKIPHVLQVVQGGGVVGAKLVGANEIQCVQFTGAPKTAALVAAQCAPLLKPFLAECGGANSLIICKDADLTAAVRYCSMSVSTLNGQWCMSASRVFIHKDLKTQFLKMMRHYLEKRMRLMTSPTDVEGIQMKELTPLEVENNNAPMMTATTTSSNNATLPEEGQEPKKQQRVFLDYGPLASEASANAIRQSISELAKTSSEVREDRRIFTLFDVEKVWKQQQQGEENQAAVPASYINVQCVISPDPKFSANRELFGSAFCLHEFENEEEAIKMTNYSTGMLCCYVFSKDVERAQNIGVQLRTCMTMVNSANFCFEVEDPSMEIDSEFWGSAGSGTDGTGAAVAKFFSRTTWSGIAGEQTHEGHELV